MEASYSALSRPDLRPTQPPIRWVWSLFPGSKAVRGVDHPSPSSTEVKERVELYLYTSSGPSWPVLGCTLFISSHYSINNCLPLTYLRGNRCEQINRLCVTSALLTESRHLPLFLIIYLLIFFVNSSSVFKFLVSTLFPILFVPSKSMYDWLPQPKSSLWTDTSFAA